MKTLRVVCFFGAEYLIDWEKNNLALKKNPIF
jgi:hypothetical protein